MSTSQDAEAAAPGKPGEWQRPGPTKREQRQDLALGLGMAVAGVIGTELAKGT